MTVFRLQPHACERAREWASLRLDGELSELEQALFASHLDRCAGCAAYAAGVSATTAEIRAAKLQHLTRPIALPLRRRIAFAARALQAGSGVAAVLAAAVGLGTLFGSSGRQVPSLSANAVRMSSSAIHAGPNTESDALVRAPRLAMLKAELGVGKQRGLGLNV
ncbi:MAG: zf-HC2 domain-containing protein [Gaiellaceae bacterium]